MFFLIEYFYQSKILLGIIFLFFFFFVAEFISLYVDLILTIDSFLPFSFSYYLSKLIYQKKKQTQNFMIIQNFKRVIIFFHSVDKFGTKDGFNAGLINQRKLHFILQTLNIFNFVLKKNFVLRLTFN